MPDTGIIDPYFFLNIKNPLIGYFNNNFNLCGDVSYNIDWFGTYHNNIFPSVPKDSRL